MAQAVGRVINARMYYFAVARGCAGADVACGFQNVGFVTATSEFGAAGKADRTCTDYNRVDFSHAWAVSYRSRFAAGSDRLISLAATQI